MAQKKAHIIKKLLPIFTVVMSFFIALVMSSSTFAQQAENVTLSPAQKMYKLDAGETEKHELTVVNDGAQAYDFVVYARPYSVKGESYEQDFQSTPPNADAYTWIRFEKTTYRLEAGRSVKVPYTIAAPAKASPGGHYGIIFVQTEPSANTQTSSVIRKKRLGSIVYATVEGEYKTSGEAVGATIPFWQLEPPLHADVKTKNTGNAEFVTISQLKVRDIFGNVKYDAKKEFVVLPQTTRKMEMEWQKAGWFGLYKVETSQVVLGKTTTSDGYVLMMPRFLPVLLFVFVVIGGIYAWVGRTRRK